MNVKQIEADVWLLSNFQLRKINAVIRNVKNEYLDLKLELYDDRRYSLIFYKKLQSPSDASAF